MSASEHERRLEVILTKRRLIKQANSSCLMRIVRSRSFLDLLELLLAQTFR